MLTCPFEQPFARHRSGRADRPQTVPRPVSGLGLAAIREAQGRDIGPAETGIGNPALPADFQHQQRVRARRDFAGRGAEQHPREQRPGGQAELRQHVGKQPVLLETIAAAPARHELAEHRIAADSDAAAKHDVEILEGDRLAVRLLQLRQPLRRGGRRSGKPDPRKICRQTLALHEAGHCTAARRAATGKAPLGPRLC